MLCSEKEGAGREGSTASNKGSGSLLGFLLQDDLPIVIVVDRLLRIGKDRIRVGRHFVNGRLNKCLVFAVIGSVDLRGLRGCHAILRNRRVVIEGEVSLNQGGDNGNGDKLVHFPTN